ncbi:hypothetical protein I8H83_04930 [Candidatus Saccharibacteria bacterium]|nr:hypothetical protein [Candidatus Saccharibacteria bacterium]
MKRSEIAMIILIASLSMLFTFTLAQSLLGDKVKQTASVEQTKAISEDLEQPAKRVFNAQAINPTVEVCVESNQQDGAAANSSTCVATPTSSEQEPAATTEETKPTTNN